MTNIRAWQVAVEVPRDGASAVHSIQVAVEVVSRSGLGVDPWTGNSARPSTFLAEALYPPERRAISTELMVEVASRSGLGRNPFEGNGARPSTFVVEVPYPPEPAATSRQLAIEVAARSGLGRDPFLGNGARVSTFVTEVVRFSYAPDEPDQITYPPGTTVPVEDGCVCVIAPAAPARMYTLRRRGRFK